MNGLIIENDLLFAKALSIKLIEMGHKVYLAKNELEAVELVNVNKVEFIVCDMVSIAADGTLQQLLKIYLDKQKPVFVTTTIPSAEKILLSMEIKGAILFEKPMIIDELVKYLQTIKTSQL